MSDRDKTQGEVPEVPSWFEKVIEKGGDISQCLSYLKEKAEKEESIKLKQIEHED